MMVNHVSMASVPDLYYHRGRHPGSEQYHVHEQRCPKGFQESHAVQSWHFFRLRFGINPLHSFFQPAFCPHTQNSVSHEIAGGSLYALSCRKTLSAFKKPGGKKHEWKFHNWPGVAVY